MHSSSFIPVTLTLLSSRPADNDDDGWIDEDTNLREPHELVGGKEYVVTFMENAALDIGTQVHLYMAVAPDAESESVDVTIRYVSRPCEGQYMLIGQDFMKILSSSGNHLRETEFQQVL